MTRGVCGIRVHTRYDLHRSRGAGHHAPSLDRLIHRAATEVSRGNRMADYPVAVGASSSTPQQGARRQGDHLRPSRHTRTDAYVDQWRLTPLPAQFQVVSYCWYFAQWDACLAPGAAATATRRASNRLTMPRMRTRATGSPWRAAASTRSSVRPDFCTSLS